MPDNKKEEKLSDYRRTIDELDQQIIDNLAQRHRIVREVFSTKITGTARIRDVEREEQLLKRVRGMAVESGLDPYFAEQLFRDIIYQSVRYQSHSLLDHQNDMYEERAITVAYQGTDGAFSHQAAMRHFHERYDDIRCTGFRTFEQAATAVEEGQANVAILPIENTTAGSINDTYDLLGEKKLHIIGEEVLRVVHCLMAPEQVQLENIRRVMSHPQAIAQCSRFLAKLPRCKIESYDDTAMAAQKVRDEADLSQAAIASAYAAEIYGLEILVKDIANQSENFTRFVVVSSNPVECDPQLPCKTSLMLATVHEKGALFKCLQVLNKHGISMTKLESRPRHGKPWQYLFYMDIEGNIKDPAVKRALKELEARAAFMKVLGCYAVQNQD
ncbi:MAG: prephenate dehydratase [Rhodothermaceae bacterium]|nr:prephenate dehydratase [Rhodothermaceae bacterium]